MADFQIFRNSVRATPSSGSGGTQSNELEAKIKSVTSSTTIGSTFIYDTRSDSDGGAWRKKCAGLSWFDETLNTATRGGRREFPSVALIVADNGGTSNVTIYDLDDPAMPMWMVINRGSGHILFGADMGSLYALNGRLYVGHNVTAGALSEISFADDFGFVRIHNTSAYNGATIADREVANSDTVTGTTGALVSRTVNDVAATIVEGSELGALGLPIPTVAVATDGGVSVIHPNGTVADDTYQIAGNNKASGIGFNSTGGYFYASNKPSTTYDFFINRHNLIYSDTSSAVGSEMYRAGATASGTPALSLLGGVSSRQQAWAATKNTYAIGSTFGLSLIKYNTGNPSEGAVCDITSDYNSGMMLGDIRFAGLANVLLNDRSVKANTLTQNGSITSAFVATDAELKAYSGWSASNYVSHASDTDFDFGTGDFSISLWVKNTNWTGTQRLLGRSQDANTKRLSIYAVGTTLYAHIKDSLNKSASADVLQNNVWQHVFAFRRGSVLYLYVDGKLVNSVTGADSINITPASNGMLVIGSETFDNGTTIESTALVNGSLTLLRISATAPTPQQVKDIYEAEKPLFRAGAKCLLQQTGNTNVNDLSYDKTTDLLTVSGTNSANGSTIFRGLEAVDTFDGQDHSDWSGGSITTVSSAGGIAAYNRPFGTGGVIVDLPAIDVRGDINIADSKLPDDGKLHFSGVTTDATPTVLGHIPIGENESLNIKARFTGYTYNLPSSSKHIVGEIKQQLYRNLGSDVSEASEQSKLIEEGNASLDIDLGVVAASQTGTVKVTGYAGIRMVWSVDVEVQRISEKQYER